jgi:DNA-binding NarL/FixJ family response regulator
VRVVIADDSLLVREGIASLLRRAGFEVEAEASTGDELVAAVEEHRPEIAIVDVRMPPTHNEEGLEAAAEIRARRPDTAIVILSSHVQAGVAMRVLAESPARLGYLLKDRVVDVEDFAATLRHVAGGGSALDPLVVSQLLAVDRDDGPLQTLTPREREVLEGVVAGMLNKQIAARLGIAEQTVKVHRARVMEKMSAASLADLVRQMDRSRVRRD